MKIVLISGSVYPVISPRAFRTMELAKGLKKIGHDVTIYSLLGNYDYTKIESRYGIKIRNLGKSHLGLRNSDNLPKKNFMSIVNALLFKMKIPRKLIEYPLIEYLFLTYKLLKRIEPFDYLITIARPHPIHFGASFFRKKYKNQKFNVWASDCGDPYMGSVNKPWPILLGRLEKIWGKYTDAITIPVESARIGYSEEVQEKIRIIPQSIDFENIQRIEYKKNEPVTFLYCGAVYPGRRDPTIFLEYLCSLDVDFKFVVFSESKIFVKFKEKLGKKLEIHARIDRIELIKIQSTMDFLINLLNDTSKQSPSKLIDYALSKRPIIDISTNFSEEEKNNFVSFMKRDYTRQHIVDNIEQFESKNVALKFIEIYDEVNKIKY